MTTEEKLAAAKAEGGAEELERIACIFTPDEWDRIERAWDARPEAAR